MSEIKPALPPDDWADWCAEVKRVDEFQREYLRRSMLDDHGTAALCLLGKPYGFTRQDVELLRHAEVYQGGWNEDGERDWEEQEQLSALADRIEALLPPRDDDDDCVICGGLGLHG